jgi:uncharacterized protein (DUF2252 family)
MYDTLFGAGREHHDAVQLANRQGLQSWKRESDEYYDHYDSNPDISEAEKDAKRERLVAAAELYGERDLAYCALPNEADALSLQETVERIVEGRYPRPLRGLRLNHETGEWEWRTEMPPQEKQVPRAPRMQEPEHDGVVPPPLDRPENSAAMTEVRRESATGAEDTSALEHDVRASLSEAGIDHRPIPVRLREMLLDAQLDPSITDSGDSRLHVDLGLVSRRGLQHEPLADTLDKVLALTSAEAPPRISLGLEDGRAHLEVDVGGLELRASLDTRFRMPDGQLVEFGRVVGIAEQLGVEIDPELQDSWTRRFDATARHGAQTFNRSLEGEVRLFGRLEEFHRQIQGLIDGAPAGRMPLIHDEGLSGLPTEPPPMGEEASPERMAREYELGIQRKLEGFEEGQLSRRMTYADHGPEPTVVGSQEIAANQMQTPDKTFGRFTLETLSDGSARVKLKIKLEARADVTEQELEQVKFEARLAMQRHFDRRFALTGPDGVTRPLRFDVEFTDHGYQHIVNLDPGAGRPNEHQWWVSPHITGIRSRAHEMGHLLGLPDEYYMDHDEESRHYFPQRTYLDSPWVHFDNTLMGSGALVKQRHADMLAEIITRSDGRAFSARLLDERARWRRRYAWKHREGVMRFTPRSVGLPRKMPSAHSWQVDDLTALWNQPIRAGSAQEHEPTTEVPRAPTAAIEQHEAPLRDEPQVLREDSAAGSAPSPEAMSPAALREMKAKVTRMVREDYADLLRDNPEAGERQLGQLKFWPSTFFQGTGKAFYRDVSDLDRDLPEVIAVGDVDPETFGVTEGAAGHLFFGPQHFDDAGRAPFTWDLRRGATAFELAAREQHVPAELRPRITRAFLEGYRDGIERFIDHDLADHPAITAAHADAHGETIAYMFAKAARANRGEFLNQRVDLAQRKFLSTDEIVPVSQRLPEFRSALADYAEEHGFSTDDILDVAEKHGRGTLGLAEDHFHVLLKQGDDPTQDRILEITAAHESVMEAAGIPREGGSPAERVVAHQRILSPDGDPWYGAIELQGKSFVVRDHSPHEVALSSGGDEMVDYARATGLALAQAHARSGDNQAIHEALDEALAEDISRFSVGQADRVTAQHEAFTAAGIDDRRTTRAKRVKNVRVSESSTPHHRRPIYDPLRRIGQTLSMMAEYVPGTYMLFAGLAYRLLSKRFQIHYLETGAEPTVTGSEDIQGIAERSGVDGHFALDTLSDGTARVRLKLKLVAADDETTQADLETMKTRAQEGMARFWDRRFAITGPDGVTRPLRFSVEFTDDGEEVAIVHRRGPEADSHEWSTGNSSVVAAHEMGHHLGLPDEYWQVGRSEISHVFSKAVKWDNSLMAWGTHVRQRHGDMIAEVMRSSTGREFAVDKIRSPSLLSRLAATLLHQGQMEFSPKRARLDTTFATEPGVDREQDIQDESIAATEVPRAPRMQLPEDDEPLPPIPVSERSTSQHRRRIYAPLRQIAQWLSAIAEFLPMEVLEHVAFARKISSKPFQVRYLETGAEPTVTGSEDLSGTPEGGLAGHFALDTLSDGTARVRLKLKLVAADDGTTLAFVETMKARAQEGMARFWDRRLAITGPDGITRPLRFSVEFTDDGEEVVVSRRFGRSTSHRWARQVSSLGIAHEMGHNLGLPDEYREFRRYHASHIFSRRVKWDNALMSTGTHVRQRHGEMIAEIMRASTGREFAIDKIRPPSFLSRLGATLRQHGQMEFSPERARLDGTFATELGADLWQVSRGTFRTIAAGEPRDVPPAALTRMQGAALRKLDRSFSDASTADRPLKDELANRLPQFPEDAALEHELFGGPGELEQQYTALEFVLQTFQEPGDHGLRDAANTMLNRVAIAGLQSRTLDGPTGSRANQRLLHALRDPSATVVRKESAPDRHGEYIVELSNGVTARWRPGSGTKSDAPRELDGVPGWMSLEM